MAEQPQPEQPQPTPAPKKGPPFKTILILLAFLVAEAATVVLILSIAGRPPDVQAEDPRHDEMLLLEEPVEELVVEDKFVNQKRGETIIFDTEVYVVVQRKHQERVQQDIEMMRARITTDIANIVRKAMPAHFHEPTHATLARQMKAALDKRLGRDPIDDETIVKEVLINRLIPYKADN